MVRPSSFDDTASNFALTSLRRARGTASRSSCLHPGWYALDVILLNRANRAQTANRSGGRGHGVMLVFSSINVRRVHQRAAVGLWSLGIVQNTIDQLWGFGGVHTG